MGVEIVAIGRNDGDRKRAYDWCTPKRSGLSKLILSGADGFTYFFRDAYLDTSNTLFRPEYVVTDGELFSIGPAQQRHALSLCILSHTGFMHRVLCLRFVSKVVFFQEHVFRADVKISLNGRHRK